MGDLITWLGKSSAEVTLWGAFTMSYKYLHIFHPSKTYLSISLPETSLSPIFQSYPFQVLDNPAKSLATSHESVYNHVSGHFSFKAKWTIRSIAWKFCSLGGFHFTIVLQGCPRKELSCCRCPLSSGAHLWCGTIWTKDLSLPCLCTSSDHRELPTKP